MFFFKRKPIVLDCFTDNSSAFAYAKPNQAIKFVPEWWKNIPKINQEEFNPPATMKQCAGFIDYFKTGYALPLWSDLDVKIGPKGTDSYAWQFADQKSSIQSHSFQQMGNFLSNEESVHLKLVNPWVFSCNEDIRWLWTSFAWHDLKNPNINVLSGVLSFKYQNGAHINMLLNRTNAEQMIHFRLGLPLAHMVPLTEKKTSIKHHLVSHDEFNKLSERNNRITFFNKYVRMKKQLEKNND